MFLITKSNRFLLKYLFNFLCFIIFNKYIQSLDINIQGDDIFDHKEIHFNLTSSKNYIIYRYKLNQEKTNFILQLNSISNIPITIYFYNNNSLNYEDNGDFCDWDNEYTSYRHINKTEFLFQTNQSECYIVFTIKKEYKRNYTDYSGSFNIFQIPVDILLNDFYINKSYFYHIYNNNYTIKDYNNIYIYRINSHNLNFNNNNEIYLHCVIKSIGAEQIIIENDNNEIIYDKNNISNLDYYLNIAESNVYTIKLISEKYIPFSVLFEIMYNKINYIGNNKTICINKLGESNYYFYDEISNGNTDEPFYYILNNYFSKNNIRVGFYRPTNIINLENLTNEELYQISLNGEYTQMQSKHETNDIDIYKYNNEEKNNTNRIFFIQIKVYNSISLDLGKICFKKLPLIKLDLGSMESYKAIYNSTYKSENIGYYYIKYNTSKNSSHKIFLYTSKIDTLTLYKGKVDIVDWNNNEGILCKNKIVEISSENITDKGYTIKLINKNDLSFAFEIINTSINSFIETSIDINKEHPNKEFYINNTIKELFLLNNINYNSNYEEIIIESRVIYGNLTLKYFNLDVIENDFDFDIKNIFNNNNNAYLGFIDIEYPILSNSSLEIIKIINGNYESKIFSEGLLYINRYHQYNNNITKNILKPFYLLQNETKLIVIDNSLDFSSFNYQISLDSKYLNILGKFYITIKIGEQVLYLNKEEHILKGKINNSVNSNDNIIIENSSSKYNFLIWIKLYISDDEEKNYPIIIPFSQFYYIDTIQNNKNYIFSFDWPNFLKCIQNDEKYISFNYFCIRIIYDDNDDNNKNNYKYITKIYHYQIIEDNNFLNNDFYLYNSINSSIENEIEPKKSLSLFQQNYDETKFKQLLDTNKALYTIINMPEQNPNVKLNFYASYIYKEILEPNSLKLFEFSENISSLDINITKPQSYNKDIFFQALFCSDTPEKKISFLYSNNTESDYKKFDIVMTKLSTSNYYGKITLKELQTINYYFNIFLPQKMYFRYLYYDNDYLLYNNYNNFYLNDDKADYNIEIERQGNKIIISFDVFNRNEITNYTVLIKNNEEEKILNECQFISLLSSNRGKNNYIVNYFMDKGNTQKVKVRIDIEKNGNYDIYILAQERNDFNLYKFIGYKEYNFTKSKEDENSNTSSNMVTFLVISNILLLSLIIGIIIYIIYKKNKNTKIINSLSNSLLEKESSSNKDNEKYEKPSTNENSEEINNSISNIQDSNFNILNKEAPLVNGSINDSFDNKFKNIMINNKNNYNNNNYINTEKGDNVDNKNNDEDASESAAPAFNFVKTQNPDENNIGYIFAERNQVKDEQKDDDALKKVFVNVETTKA